MGSSKARSYSKKFKEQIIKECIETKNYNAVARKHGVPSTTVYTWIRKNKNRHKIKKDKDKKSLEKEPAEAKLENEILLDDLIVSALLNQLVIRSDNGSQITSNAFINHISSCREDQIVHELIPPETPNKNAHIEAFNSILEIEFLQPRYFMTYGRAYQETVRFMEFYNTRRIYRSLKKKTPMEIYEQYKTGEGKRD
jgi:transposase-like protein